MRHAAQIVFIQSSSEEHKWIGRLLNPAGAIDTQCPRLTKGNPQARCVIEEYSDGRCGMYVQGASRGGRRYSVHDNLTEAQKAGIRWAGRRFKIEVEA